MTKLFISYRSLDSARVDSLVARLRSLKDSDNKALYNIWLDKTSIPPGQDWWESIVDAIIDCDVFVFMVSGESVKNVNCRAELSYARKRNRPVIPLVLEDEFFYNPITGKNDIGYWQDVPQELDDLRSQLLFYEGTAFLRHFETAIARFQRESRRWRDIPADRPTDPRHVSEAINNAIALYDEACDYAWRMELDIAERLFQKLVNMNDVDFGEDAHEWILILRDYQKIVELSSRKNTQYRVLSTWQDYIEKFPKPFTSLFDPKNFEVRYSDERAVTPTASIESEPSNPIPPPQKQTTPSLSQPTRQKHNVNAILPAPFEWIEIPAGRVTLIPDDVGKEERYLKTNATVEGPAFSIAKYPVTNAQYARFVEAGGYQQSEWWTESGWQWRNKQGWIKPLFWTDSKRNGAEQPVIGVSWYEVVAFCLWLSKLSDEQIVLPTEAQWQWAAQGDDNRLYPWGNEWDASRCNTKESGIKNPTPVRQYEGKGDSPFGVVDMAGNVWEWCLTNDNTGFNEMDDRPGRLVVRGGSWYHDRDHARTVYRTRMPSTNRASTRGFRIAKMA